MVRINFADHLFLRMHHGLGSPVFNQFLWQFDEIVDVSTLENLHTALGKGLLNRQCVGSRIPLARHRWIAASGNLPLYLEPIVIDVAQITEWARRRISDSIDPEAGYGWELSAATVAGTSPLGENYSYTVLSLVCSHMVADGSAMVDAVCAATSRMSNPETSSDTYALDSSRVLGADVSLLTSVVSDLHDVAGRLETIFTGAARQLSGSVHRGANPATTEKRETAPTRLMAGPEAPPDWTPPSVYAECSSAQWRAAAERQGGTSNSLFVAVIAAIVQASGRAEEGDELHFALPVTDRHVGDIRSNATKIVPVTVTVAQSGNADLAAVRKSCKIAFEQLALVRSRAESDPVPLGALPTLIQMVPDWVARRIPRPPGDAEALVSNLGAVPTEFTTIGRSSARRVSARAAFADCDAEYARSLGGSIMAWAADTNHRIVLTVHGMEPGYFPDSGSLRAAMSTAFARWELDVEFW